MKKNTYRLPSVIVEQKKKWHDKIKLRSSKYNSIEAPKNPKFPCEPVSTIKVGVTDTLKKLEVNVEPNHNYDLSI